MDMQGRKLSKRDGDVEVSAFRAAGYLPEVLVNFISLLGWRSGDRERFTLPELVEAFCVEGIGKANAKFDRDKLLAFNTDALAAAGEDRLLAGFKDFLAVNPQAGIPRGDDALLRRLLKANTGLRTFQDVVNKCAVLFGPDDAFSYDAKAVDKVLRKGEPGATGLAVLADARAVLASCQWTQEALEGAMEGFCRATNLGMGKVAQPIRVAVTGTTISPPIHDTLLFLGKEKALARIDRCLAAHCGKPR
jgi:glutamyl-tRNA synthetase